MLTAPRGEPASSSSSSCWAATMRLSSNASLQHNNVKVVAQLWWRLRCQGIHSPAQTRFWPLRFLAAG